MKKQKRRITRKRNHVLLRLSAGMLAVSLRVCLFATGLLIYFRQSSLFAVPRAQTKKPSFVTRCGTSFCLEGRPWVPYGASVTIYKYPQDLPPRGEPEKTMALAKHANLNIVRIVNWLHEENDPATEPYRDDHMRVVDQYIAAAGARGLKVAIDSSTYYNTLRNHNINPFTHDWSQFFEFMTNRVNTVTGKVYKDDPTIAFWFVAGEVDAPEKYGMTKTDYVAGWKAMLTAGQSRDTNHLWATGGFLGLNGNSPIPWQDVFALPENDYCSIHVYSQPDQDDTIPKVANYCASIGKPWLNEEFGAEQWQGDWTPCTSQTYCGDRRRADTFQRVYDKSRAFHAAGMLFWNLGFEVRGVNKSGETADVNPQTPLTWEVVLKNAPMPNFAWVKS
jgi:hypothetical protein